MKYKRYNKNSVKNFYNTFDFSKVITHFPKLIEEFINIEESFLKRYFKKEKSILEIGCGYGRILEALAKKKLKLTGIDYSHVMLKKAKEKLKPHPGIKLKLMNAEALKFRSKFFYYTICINASFGNMPGIEKQVLREMKRVTKPGGEIIITVYSENARKSQIKNYQRLGLNVLKEDKNAIYTKEGLYSRRFSRKEINELFKEAGLRPKICRLNKISYLVIAKK